MRNQAYLAGTILVLAAALGGVREAQRERAARAQSSVPERLTAFAARVEAEAAARDLSDPAELTALLQEEVQRSRGRVFAADWQSAEPARRQRLVRVRLERGAALIGIYRIRYAGRWVTLRLAAWVPGGSARGLV